MTKKFAELKKKMSPERRARATKRTDSMLREMALADLRRARSCSQVTLARAMHLRQPDISKLERRTDTYVSTLRKYVEALGGSLSIVAHFPEADVSISQFSELAPESAQEDHRVV